MDFPHTLDRLPIGEEAPIYSLEATGSRRRRLLDLGFVPGATTAALQASPWGDPVAYLIRGAVIALRREDAAAIIIGKKEDPHG